MLFTSITAVVNNIRITTERDTSQPDKTYNQFDVLRKEGLYQGPGPHEITFIFFLP